MSKVGFFEEKEGVRSLTRLMSFFSLFAAFMAGAIILLSDTPLADGMLIFYGFLLGAFAPKLVQKFAEEKVK